MKVSRAKKRTWCPHIVANGEILFGLDRYFYKKFDFQMDFLQKLGENCWRNFFPRIRLESFLTDDLLSNAIAMLCTQEDQTFLWISMQSSSLWTRREKMDPFHRCFRSIPKKVGWIDKKVWLFLAVGLANSITIFKENMTVIYNVHTITTVSKKE